MEQFFSSTLPDGKRPDLQLCIFPHLREFLAVDLRGQRPRVLLLDTADVFNQEFLENIEAEFSQVVREKSEFPFAHLINLPLRMEEIIREVAMTFILERLGVEADEEDEVPSLVVFIISGGALAMQSERLVEGLRGLLGEFPGEPAVEEWEATLSRLVSEEHAALQRVNQQELAEALSGESPDLFTLWEHRN